MDVEEKHILQISDLAKNVPSLASNQNQSSANAFYSGQVRLRDLLVPTADGVREPQNRRVQIVYEGGHVVRRCAIDRF
jgi:hypothetical protein